MQDIQKSQERRDILKIGFTELMVVFIVALFVIGPDKLPEYARKLGEALAQFKKVSDAATKDIKESIVEPLEEAQRPLREAMEPLEQINDAVTGNMKDVQKSLADIGKPRKTSAKARTAEESPVEETATEEQPQTAAETVENSNKSDAADESEGSDVSDVSDVSDRKEETV
jgi:sec-independent protein translocase protein TatB